MSHELKHAGGKSTGGIGAEDFSKVASQLSGEDRVPDAPSMPLLTLITMIRKADPAQQDAWSPMVESELRHLKAAVHLLATQPQIAYRFGQSMEGAMQLVGILKARASEKDVHRLIDGVVDSHLAPSLPSTSFVDSNAFVAAGAQARAVVRAAP